MFVAECYPYLHLTDDGSLRIEKGSKVKLGRFQLDMWMVDHGWYSWGGNRPVCGWYLTNIETSEVKPLQQTDLDDIYIIES